MSSFRYDVLGYLSESTRRSCEPELMFQHRSTTRSSMRFVLTTELRELLRGSVSFRNIMFCIHQWSTEGRNRCNHQAFRVRPYHGVNATYASFALANTNDIRANDKEDERMGYDSVLSLRSLHEIYLMPFILAQKHMPPWSIMTAYVEKIFFHETMSDVGPDNNKPVTTV